MSDPTTDPRLDFAQKSAAAIAAVSERPDCAKSKIPYARRMNLMMGHDARSPAEEAMKAALLRELAELFPGDAYPALAEAAEAVTRH